MFGPAEINIHRQPIIKLIKAVSEIVPRRTGPIRHGVGFPLGRAATMRTFCIHPVFDIGQRRLTRAGRLVFFNLGQLQRQVAFRQRYPTGSFLCAFWTIDHWNRLAPIVLAAENPVSQMITNHPFPPALFLNIVHHFLGCLMNIKAV